MAAVSPSSSPRLPSPPPIAEDQIGPTSPGVSLFEDHGKFPGASNVDTGASRRIRAGTRADDMAEGPPVVELLDIDSAFPLSEHLKALHYRLTHPPGSPTIHPVNAEVARQLAQPPPNTSREIWLYELGRFLIQKTNAIIVALFADSPPCSPQTCPEMRASEWQYLCAVHDPPKSCSAIDYCCHTLDWAATSLTGSKMFPSRLSLGSGSSVAAGGDKLLQQQMKEIKNIFRRVYRIYAHAWFQHREMFWRVEGKTGLYVFFKIVCDEYGIIESENYTIPREAEGAEPEQSPTRATMQTPSLLKREQEQGFVQGMKAGESTLPELEGAGIMAMGDTTKRHRHTMSDLSSSVTTVIQEEVEDEDEEVEETLAEPQALNSQSTAINDVAHTTATMKQEEASDDEPIPRIERSGTIKATSDETSNQAATSKIEASTESSSKTQTESIGAEEKTVAESDDIPKSVGD